MTDLERAQQILKGYKQPVLKRRTEEPYDYSYFSDSHLDTWLRCPRKEWYVYEHSLSIGNANASAGLVFHKGIETWDLTGNVELAGVELLKKYHEFEFPQDDERFKERRFYHVLVQYSDFYSANPYPIKYLASPFSFRLPFLSGGDLVGELDAVISLDGRIDVLERKTTSSIGKTTVENFTNSRQNKHYVWALRTILKPHGLDYLVRGATYDIIAFTKTSATFHRFSFSVSDTEIEDWARETQRIIQEITDSRFGGFDEIEPPRKNRTQCFNYGTCPFLLICEMHSKGGRQGLEDGLRQFKRGEYSPV